MDNLTSTLGVVQLLFAALALVMAGLGLSLELEDFRRIARQRRPVAVGMVLQLLVMPALAYAVAVTFRVSAPCAVGLMLLAAAPGSVSSSVYSRVFGGDVALNMSLTGLNTLLSMVTLPLICGWAQAHFASVDGAPGSPVLKLAQSMAALVLPVVLGMIVRFKRPRFAAWADKPMRIFSLLVLVVFSAGAIVSQWASLKSGFAEVGFAVVAFNGLSLVVGYGLTRWLCTRESAMAIAFELGVRSAVLSIYVAMTTLHDSRIALPAAVYSITMVVFALVFGSLMHRLHKPALAPLASRAGA